MSPYTILSSGVGSREATDLSARLSAWHDAMVAHERRLRAGTTSDACDEECAHAEAHALWAEAIATFGARAHGLTFLRSRALGTRGSERSGGRARAHAEAAEYARARRQAPESNPDKATSSATAGAAGTELES